MAKAPHWDTHPMHSLKYYAARIVNGVETDWDRIKMVARAVLDVPNPARLAAARAGALKPPALTAARLRQLTYGLGKLYL